MTSCKIKRQTAVIQSDGMVVRVTVELRGDKVLGVFQDYKRTGYWFSCVTDLEGNILGGQTCGSGDTKSSPLAIACNLLIERQSREREQQ